MADGADLAQIVGDGQQLRRAGKEFAAEVGPQAVAQHGDVEVVGDTGELPDLALREELRLVDKDATDLLPTMLACNPGMEVVCLRIELRRCIDADARGDAAIVGGCVERRREQQRPHAALLVVVRGLQQDGGFSCIHRGVGEVELRHGRSSCPTHGRAAKCVAALWLGRNGLEREGMGQNERRRREPAGVFSPGNMKLASIWPGCQRRPAGRSPGIARRCGCSGTSSARPPGW